MKNSKVIDLIKEKNIVIPLYMYKLYTKLNISLEEFFFIMYLNTYGEKISFNLEKISDELSIEVPIIMNYISRLTELKLLNVEVIKNDKGIREEFITLTDFYNKLSLLLIENINTLDKIDGSIFESFEKEFGRTLSPMEYEIIKAWFESDFSEELIELALKEASFNGVANLRYIDTILHEWRKKGLQNKEAVEKHLNMRERKKETKPKEELFDYNWFDDEEY